MDYTWVPIYKKIAKKLLEYKDKQKELVEIIYDSGITIPKEKETTMKLGIDPFTFFALINKYSQDEGLKRNDYLKNILKDLSLDLNLPEDYKGVPKSQPTNSIYFDNEKELSTLWELFISIMETTNKETINENFNNSIKINGMGKAKITQSIFWIAPDEYLPIDQHSKTYLKKYKIDTNFENYHEYLSILNKVEDNKKLMNKEFYEISNDAYVFNKQNKIANHTFWIFQANPKTFNLLECIENHKKITYKTPQNFKAIKKGDRVFLWLAGENAGIYALSEVTSMPDFIEEYEYEKKYWLDRSSNSEERKNKSKSVRLNIMKIFNEPLLKSKIEKYKDLENLQILKIPRQTNFKLNKTEAKTLIGLLNIDNQGVTNMPNENIEPKIDAKTLQREKNIILYGPPGTGKTYNVVNYALAIIEGKTPENYNTGDPGKRAEYVKTFNEYKNNGQIEFITFHQSYSYEEFVEGLKAKTDKKSKEIIYDIEDGIFKKIAELAKINYQESFQKEDDINIENLLQAYSDYVEEKINEDNKIYLDYKETRWLERINKFNNGKFRSFYTGGSVNHQNLSATIITRDYQKFKHGKISSYKDIKPAFESQSAFHGNAYYYFELFNKIKEFETNIYSKSTKSKIKAELKNFIIIIDEINRGNISKILGELITIIETDKRIGEKNELITTLPYSEEPFGIPSNLHIIGTMNTADHSIALVDTALRRRFTFIEMMPEYEKLNDDVEGINLKKMLGTINKRITFLIDRDHQIGHSYFLEVNDFNTLQRVFRYKIFPLLNEYFYNDWEKIRLVLGDNNKNKEYQFVIEKGIENGNVFSGNVNDMDLGLEDKKVYEVNDKNDKNAFSKQEAYIQIYQGKGAVNES